MIVKDSKEKSSCDEFFMTQQEVADCLGLSRPHVGSIEKRAYAKARNMLRERGIKIEDLLGGMA